MSRDILRLTIEDLSHFTKSLRSQLQDPPSHAETLAIVARAAGYRNYQHLRADLTPEPQANAKQVARALRYFDETGQWADWPGKRGIRELCLWVVWAKLPARTSLSEREISALINTHTVFRDAAQIRRSLIEMGLMDRNTSGSRYERIEQRIPPEAQVLIRRVKERSLAHMPPASGRSDPIQRLVGQARLDAENSN